MRSIELEVACDVRTRFVDAAAVFATAEGRHAGPGQLLTARLNRLADATPTSTASTSAIEGAGAAGGLAGGLLALGGRLVPGFDLVADHVDLHDRLAAADVVVTGEGYLDARASTARWSAGGANWPLTPGSRSS